ncbi:MAG: hypothetical protein II793_02520 [Bacteroidales bacterium]|nr:hypothetical protein [Bacteroidales bacterium]
MGTYKNGILGGFSGKVGTVIGSFWKGRNVMRAVPAHVSDPATPLQQAQRARFALVGRFVAACQGFINVGYVNQTATITAGNAAVRDNLQNGSVQGTGTNVSLDYTRVSLSSGSHVNPANPAAAQGTGHTIDVSWTDNTGVSPEVLSTDIVMVCLYNPSRMASTYDVSSASRLDASLTIAYPSLWVGDEVHVFLATRSIAGTLVSPTLHLASITVA